MLQHLPIMILAVGAWETSPLLNVFAGSTLLLGAAWLASGLMRRSSAAARHLIWCAALGAVPLLAGLSFVLPAWHVLPAPKATTGAAEVGGAIRILYALPAIEIGPADAPEMPTPVATPAGWHIGWQGCLVIAWGIGVVAALIPTVLGRWLLMGVERSCVSAEGQWDVLLRQAQRAIGVSRPVTLLLSAARAMPMTWGIWRARVLFPAEAQRWRAGRRRVVLLHELGHVKRRDALTQLLAQVVRAMYWFQPLAWIALWRMQVEMERACDDLVLQLGTPETDYAEDLVEVTAGLRRSQYAMAAIAMARPSRLARRVREVLDGRRNRRAVTRRHMVVTVALVGLLAIPVAIIKGGGQVQAQTPKPEEAAQAPGVDPVPPAAKIPAWDQWSSQAQACSENGRNLGLAILNYASQHEWRLPPDLGATLPYMQELDPQTGAFKAVPPTEAARYYLCPIDRARIAVPAAPTPEWINQNTSYAYLGGADVNMDALSEEQFDNAVIVHEKSNGTHPEMAGNPIALSLGGGYAQPQTAERIDWSRQAMNAARGAPSATGGQPRLARMWTDIQAAPKASECARHQAEIGKALAIYQNFNKGHYPPTLGDTLPYVLKYSKHHNPLTGQDEPLTPEQAAQIYLCSQEQDIEIPKDVTPEWINEHTSFVYLGDETLTEDANPAAAILYERPDRGHGGMAIMLYVDSHAQAESKEQAQAIIDRSVVMLEADRARVAERAAEGVGNSTTAGTAAAGTETRGRRVRGPADPNAARVESLRRLMQVLVEDTRDHRGRLPDDLVHVVKFATEHRGPKAPPALSLQAAARLVLSPSAAKDLKVPEKPSNEWLRQNASYEYLGDQRLTVDLMQAGIPMAKWPQTVLVHEKPVEGDPWVAVATLDLGCRLMEVGKAKDLIEESKRLVAGTRTRPGATVSVATASQAAGGAKHPAERWRGGKVEKGAAGAAIQIGDGKGEATGREGSGSGRAER